MKLFTHSLASEIRKEAKARGHKNSGYLSSERGTYAQEMDKDTWVIKMPYYTEFLERGTPKPFIPKTRKTQLWARKHGMSFAMMRYFIGKHGTQAYPFTGTVINREIKRLKETMEKQLNQAIKQK